MTVMITIMTIDYAVDDSCSSGLLCRGARVTRWQGGWQVFSKYCLCLSIDFKTFLLLQKRRSFSSRVRRMPVADPGLL